MWVLLEPGVEITDFPSVRDRLKRKAENLKFIVCLLSRRGKISVGQAGLCEFSDYYYSQDFFKVEWASPETPPHHEVPRVSFSNNYKFDLNYSC